MVDPTDGDIEDLIDDESDMKFGDEHRLHHQKMILLLESSPFQRALVSIRNRQYPVNHILHGL